MSDQLVIIVETFILATLFFSADLLSFGRKKEKRITVFFLLWCALITTVINNFFYNSDLQYFAYISILLFMGIVFSYFFIDAPLTYTISLQLNMFGCFSMVKRIIPSGIRLISHHATMSNLLEILYYSLYAISLLLLCYFFIRFALHPRIIQPINYWLTMIAIPAIILIMANTSAISLMRENWEDSWYSTVINTLMLGLLLLSHYLSYLNVNSYNELLDSQSMNQQMALQLSQIERSSALVEQIRRDKHEMKNVYFYIHTMLEENDIEKLKDFVNTHLLHRYDRLEEFHTGHDTLDYLLSQKASEARALGMTFLADIQTPLQISVESNDLCALLLNLLDNGIEAGKDIAHPDIQILIAEKKNYLSITVKNKVDSDVVKENPGLKTTKKDSKNHGIGLRIIRSIVKKYDGMFSTKVQDGYFIANVFLKQSI